MSRKTNNPIAWALGERYGLDAALVTYATERPGQGDLAEAILEHAVENKGALLRQLRERGDTAAAGYHERELAWLREKLEDVRAERHRTRVAAARAGLTKPGETDYVDPDGED